MAEQRDDRDRDDSGSGTGGQVSEVSGMEAAGAGEQIMPDQATAGAPDADSGETQEGTAGPNARPRDNRPGESRPESEEPHAGRADPDQPA